MNMTASIPTTPREEMQGHDYTTLRIGRRGEGRNGDGSGLVAVGWMNGLDSNGRAPWTRTLWIAGGTFGVMGWLAKEVYGVCDLREGRKGIQYE